MSYNATLETKIDAASTRWKNVEKKKMFGGVCYLFRGNMAFGIWKDFLIVRMARESGEQALRGPNVKPFDITGKTMTGWIMVNEAGWKRRPGLEKWLGIGKEYALSLPEKTSKARTTKTLREYQP